MAVTQCHLKEFVPEFPVTYEELTEFDLLEGRCIVIAKNAAGITPFYYYLVAADPINKIMKIRP